MLVAGSRKKGIAPTFGFMHTRHLGIKLGTDVAVNWSMGLMRWQPHINARGKAIPLNHLHPLRYTLQVSAQGHSQPVDVGIAVGFGLHCFTRNTEPNDDDAESYCDGRESRTFCPDRYALSVELPTIARSLITRKCGFAKAENYVTVDVRRRGGNALRYGVFFNIKEWKANQGLGCVLVAIQSAYELSPTKQLPLRGNISFTRLVELTLQGIRPRPPR
jgi:hypothetical protein